MNYCDIMIIRSAMCAYCRLHWNFHPLYLTEIISGGFILNNNTVHLKFEVGKAAFSLYYLYNTIVYIFKR